MSDFTPEQVERAAKVFVRFPAGLRMYWHSLSDLSIQERRKLARAVLSAAGAPEKAAPVQIDPSELAAKIYSLEYQVDPDSATPDDVDERLGMADELIEWFAERRIPVVDEDALAAVIHRAACGPKCKDESPMRADHKVARAVAAYLRGESK